MPMDALFDAGRTASARILAVELDRAPISYVEGALVNPVLDPGLVLLILQKNRGITGSLISRIGRNRAWLKPYEVKAAIVLHPKTPRPLAMGLIQFLWWRDLARVADQASLAPPLRRAAERLLEIRQQELALGEKVALARIATRGVIGVLRRTSDPMVMRALLQNPRLLEEDALAIASRKGTAAGVLQALAEDHRLSVRPALQRALVQNPATPPAAALHLLKWLTTQALKDLAHAPYVPTLVKVAALRMVEARTHPE
jgi:hypothetical protein